LIKWQYFSSETDKHRTRTRTSFKRVLQNMEPYAYFRILWTAAKYLSRSKKKVAAFIRAKEDIQEGSPSE
jgi:hypothetical protein